MPAPTTNLTRFVAALALVLTLVAAACVPSGEPQPSYGSVAISLSAPTTSIVLSDGWTFTLEHLFSVPSMSLGPYATYGSDAGICSASPDSPSGQTLVDYVLGTSIHVNQVVPNGACTDLMVDSVSSYSTDLQRDPGVSEAEATSYVGDARLGDLLPSAFVLGTATRGGESKRLSLRLGGGQGGVVDAQFECSPIREPGGEPETLGVANVRTTFHLTFDLAALFPGSPPQFGPLAAADADGDGVITADEVGACEASVLAVQIEKGWQLAPEDGACAPIPTDAGTPPAPCDLLRAEGRDHRAGPRVSGVRGVAAVGLHDGDGAGGPR